MSINTPFINDNFLLQNKFAEELYHNYAKDLPIIDYHCHLSPQDIATNRTFNNLTEVWINGDHYKWRAMRTLGIKEKYITGNASDQEKFKAWAKTVPHTLRNPLYHWTHLEMARYFDINELLNEQNADAVYSKANDILNNNQNSCQDLLTKMNVEVVCTTEDPLDNLDAHIAINKSNIKTKVSTSFRPDKAILIGNDGFIEYISALANTCNISISTYDQLCDALLNRLAYFNENGCQLADHGLEKINFEPASDKEVASIFTKKLEGKVISLKETQQFETAVLLFLSKQYNEMGWVQQFHLGALRNNNKRMLATLGPDTGWDSIGDFSQARNLSSFLNALDSEDQLAKTIIYNLNPADNEIFASMIGNFNDGSVKGKVQFGSGWWFLDQKDGMIKQINALSNMGLISCFIGMLTDSRSFLSFPRHEYFRRILCNLLGEEILKGELPQDLNLIGGMVKDISYFNAKNYFNF